MDEVRERLAELLRDAPQMIAKAEQALVLAQEAEEEAEWELERTRDKLLLEGAVTGKNQEEREAHMRALTAELVARVRALQRETRRNRVRLHQVENAFSSQRHRATLLGPDPAALGRLEQALHVYEGKEGQRG